MIRTTRALGRGLIVALAALAALACTPQTTTAQSLPNSYGPTTYPSGGYGSNTYGPTAGPITSPCSPGFVLQGGTCVPETLGPNAYGASNAYGTNGTTPNAQGMGSPAWASTIAPQAGPTTVRSVGHTMPANAYPEPMTKSVKARCAWGYRRVDGSCVEIIVPKHAHLVPADEWHAQPINARGWRCDRGFDLSGQTCVRPVSSAYTAEPIRTGGACPPGHRRHKSQCLPEVVPLRADRGLFGGLKDCSAPYRRSGEACVLPH